MGHLRCRLHALQRIGNFLDSWYQRGMIHELCGSCNHERFARLVHVDRAVYELRLTLWRRVGCNAETPTSFNFEPSFALQLIGTMLHMSPLPRSLASAEGNALVDLLKQVTQRCSLLGQPEAADSTLPYLRASRELVRSFVNVGTNGPHDG